MQFIVNGTIGLPPEKKDAEQSPLTVDGAPFAMSRAVRARRKSNASFRRDRQDPLTKDLRPEEGKFFYPVQEGKMPAAAMDITAMSIEPDAVRNNIK